MSQGGSDNGVRNCFCAWQSECPWHYDTIQETKKNVGEGCRLVQGGLEPIDMIVPELLSPVATTAGPSSLMTDRGRYAPLQFANMNFSCTLGAINIRTSQIRPAFDNRCLVALLDRDEDRKSPSGFQIFGDSGSIVHRIHLVIDHDQFVMKAAAQTIRSWNGPLAFLADENDAADPSGNVISLMSHLATRDQWSDMGVEGHLNEIMADGGPRRRLRLRRCSDKVAWKIPRSILPAFLFHLAEQKTDFTRVIPRPTLLQAHHGPLDDFQLQGSMALLFSGSCMTALDLAAVRDFYAVSYGDPRNAIVAIELYDADGMCMAAFFADKKVTAFAWAPWRDLVQSLPRLD